MTLEKLLRDLKYEVICGDVSTEITDITNDSRKVTDGGLYFAVPGAKVDGAEFIPEVIRKGASAIITEKSEEKLGHILENDMLLNGEFEEIVEDRVTIILVEDTRVAMGIISSEFYGNPSEEIRVIGITGTKGKTTTSYMVKEMLELAGIKTGLIGTIEIDDGANHIPALNTTPESIVIQKTLRDMVNNDCEAVVMEISSQAMLLHRVSGLDVDYAIFTNLSPDHIGPNEHSDYEAFTI